ncbi:hypothetical protein CASFOL_032897 [Castilleja foliolosa]|uniref:COBRA-like protein n=1 Tax=Castilleja foliolosa TaxID=1961234 RepID=A0ABD3C2U0_9LAMI
MGICFGSTHAILLFFLLSCVSYTSTAAPNQGNITIKWDVISWTPDGYVAVVSIFNYQPHRNITSPGWTLGWAWARKEVIWSMIGSRTIEQGDCSRFKGNIPHCCKKDPKVVDLSRKTPYNQRVDNCCKGGVLGSWAQGPMKATSSFQLAVGAAGTTNNTVRVPGNFTLRAPGPARYACGAAKIVRPTRFVTPDGRRVTQAIDVECYLRIYEVVTWICLMNRRVAVDIQLAVKNALNSDQVVTRICF